MKKYILFLDESGIANLLDKSYKKFLLTGVIIDISEESMISGYFNFIKAKYGFDLSKPFHSFDLFENSKSPYFLTPLRSKNFILSFLEFLKIVPVNVKVVAANKESFRKLEGLRSDSDFKGNRENKDKKEILYTLAATKIFYYFAEILDKNDASGSIVLESRKGQDIYLLKAYNNSKEQLQRKDDAERDLSRMAKERVHSITFADKSSFTYGLEIVDLISYSFFHKIDRERRIKQYSQIKLNKIPLAVKMECNADCLEMLNPFEYKDLFKTQKS